MIAERTPEEQQSDIDATSGAPGPMSEMRPEPRGNQGTGLPSATSSQAPSSPFLAGPERFPFATAANPSGPGLPEDEEVRRHSRAVSWRRRLRAPRSLKVTRTGRTYLVITVGVGLGALNTGNNLLYLVLGLLLSMIVVSGVLSERCLRDLEVERLGSDGAFAGELFPFRYRLRKGRSAAFALVVREEGLLEGDARLAWLKGGTEQVVRATMRAARRGPLTLTGIQVTTTFPLGLFAKSRIYDRDDVLLVFPRRGAEAPGFSDDGTGANGERHRPQSRDGTADLVGLRELGEREDARHIHWLKSAAAGTLLRTEREKEERQQFILTLDPGLAAGPLDRRCEELAARAHRLLQQGHEVGLRGGGLPVRAGAGSGQERLILASLAWAGFAAPGHR